MTKKIPKKGSSVSPDKKPQKGENPERFLSKNPAWKFCLLDAKHPRWSVKNDCNFNEDILERLVSFEGQTWSEIINGSFNHHISVSNLIKDAQKRLEYLKIMEDELFSLRLGGKERLFGILDGGVFHIVWYDCNHEICPSHKKHT